MGINKLKFLSYEMLPLKYLCMSTNIDTYHIIFKTEISHWKAI